MPVKTTHEVRDPIHGFISYSTAEREVIDSVPFQRLRNIHQLALTYLVYPGATHRRFEHSLGVMELATRIFDEITNMEKLRQLPELTYASLPSLPQADFNRAYWRQVLRMGALCHDLGHLPFSHAAEKELLAPGVKHEHISWKIIYSDLMAPLWKKLKIDPEHVAKIAVGKKDAPPGVEFDVWETLLAEIVVGDVFGADRMDYLLRDAHHAGVAYGKFDHLRLIKTLRILPRQEGEDEEEDLRVAEPNIGIERGGLQAAESLLWARYLMFSQVYLHPVRRIYDIHLKEFMLALLGGDLFPSDELEKFISITDIEIQSALRQISQNVKHVAHEHARRILERDHFKVVWEKNARDGFANPDMAATVHDLLGEKFGVDNVRVDTYEKSGLAPDFPVLMASREVTSACNESKILLTMPPAEISCVFIRADLREKAVRWLEKNRARLATFQLREDGEP